MPSLRVGLTSILAVVILACGNDEGSDVPAEAESTEAPSPSSESYEGGVTFSIDGQTYAFDHIVVDETYSMSAASSLVAKPDAGATERFGLTVVGMDLDDYDYPTELPPEDAGTSIRAAMMMIGFSFTGAEGEEWAGPGSLRVESFDDGVLVATFGEVILPHTDDELPDVTLAGGEIRAQLE